MVIFDSVSAFKDPDSDFKMKHVARATSAAPTFFSSAEFYNITGTRSYSLIDGGVGKNNPAYFVIERAKEKAENYGLGKTITKQINFHNNIFTNKFKIRLIIFFRK